MVIGLLTFLVYHFPHPKSSTYPCGLAPTHTLFLTVSFIIKPNKLSKKSMGNSESEHQVICSSSNSNSSSVDNDSPQFQAEQVHLLPHSPYLLSLSPFPNSLSILHKFLSSKGVFMRNYWVEC